MKRLLGSTAAVVISLIILSSFGGQESVGQAAYEPSCSIYIWTSTSVHVPPGGIFRLKGGSVCQVTITNSWNDETVVMSGSINRDFTVPSEPGTYHVYLDAASAHQEIEVTVASPHELPLTLQVGSVYWHSYSDYLSRLLSIDFIISNGGTNDAMDFELVNSFNPTSVWPTSCDIFSPPGCQGFPQKIGNILAGQQATATVKYFVPANIGSFKTNINARAFDINGFQHWYPGDIHA